MAEKRSVYLTRQALAMPRPFESLSWRLNRALERYAWMLEHDGPSLRESFTTEHWRAFVRASTAWRELPADALARAVRANLGTSARGLTDAELVMLADLAEGEADT